MEYADPGKSHSYVKLIAAVLLCLVVGSMGSLVTTTGSGSWYESLEKPAFTPPNWVFGPVWTTLFILMGIALYLVWQSGTERRDVQIALAVFGIQFALNVLWSFLFFGLHLITAAFIEVCLVDKYAVKLVVTVGMVAVGMGIDHRNGQPGQFTHQPLQVAYPEAGVD